MYEWIWPLAGIIGAVIVVAAIIYSRRRKTSTDSPQSLTEEQRFGDNYYYGWLKRVEATDSPSNLNDLYSYGVGTGAWRHLGEEFKDRFESAYQKMLAGYYRFRADSLLKLHGHPDELDAERLDRFYRSILAEGSGAEVALLLDIDYEEARRSVIQRMRDQFNILVTALESCNKADFDALNDFLLYNASYAQGLGADDIAKPPSWDKWVTFHYPNPHSGQFVRMISEGSNELALRAADALRTDDIVLAKVVLATCGSGDGGRKRVGVILYTEIVKMVAAHNALDADSRLKSIGLDILVR